MIINDRVILAKENMIISYKKGKLLIRKKITDKPKALVKIPNKGLKRYAARIPVLERLLRLEPRFAFPFDEKKFYLSYDGAMYIVNCEDSSIKKVHEYRSDMHNPLNACIVDGIDGFDKGLYYGEYWGNRTHDAVSIYVGNDEKWVKKYTFPRSSILHIHAIIPDEKNNQMLILTGDSDSESSIWVAKNNFNQVSKLCGGTQQFRSCCAYANRDSLIYATDTPLENNYLYEYSNDSGTPTKITEISGPCIYSTKLTFDNKTYCIFATSVESDSKMLSGWKYKLSTKPGPGVKDDFTHIYITDFCKVKEVSKYKKDFLPYLLFQFGNIRFPYQDSFYQDKLFICPQSIKHLHGKTVILDMFDLVNEMKKGNE